MVIHYYMKNKIILLDDDNETFSNMHKNYNDYLIPLKTLPLDMTDILTNYSELYISHNKLRSGLMSLRFKNVLSEYSEIFDEYFKNIDNNDYMHVLYENNNLTLSTVKLSL